jgi:lysine-specific histone demethylase 1
VAILFEQKFWEDDIDWFGKVITHNTRENRGLCYLWWNYYKVVKRPVLVAIVAGKACHAIELRRDEDLITEVKGLLKGMFKLNEDPKIVKYVITRWKTDQYAGGTYSYVALGATGEDYDKLAKTVQVFGNNRLFFGGEHTCRQYPATVAGAYASGLREAEKIHRIFHQPPNPTFRPPPIINEMDKTREANRKKLVKKTQKVNKSRTQARFRRGVRRHISNTIGSGNELFKFNYQYLYGKKEQNFFNPSLPMGENSGQFQTYAALLNKKKKNRRIRPHYPQESSPNPRWESLVCPQNPPYLL